MKIPFFQINAFTSGPLSGNPAGVCPLEAWLPEKTMQAIAAKINLSETAFFVPTRDDWENAFQIRWFTPTSEVSLCGHATLASAWCVFHELGCDKDEIVFQSKSGPLIVTREKDLITLNFPSDPPQICEPPQRLLEAFKKAPVECLKAMDYIMVFEDEDEVAGSRPDLELLKKLNLRGVIITAPSEKYGFVCRFFAPGIGIDEDPVTGSACTELMPYWADRTGKKKILIRQLSAQGGEMLAELRGGRVLISGRAVKYREGRMESGAY